MAQILNMHTVDFTNHRAIGIVVSFSNSIGKGRRCDHHELFTFESRFVIAPREQWTRPVAERYGSLVAEPIKVVLRGLRKD